MSTITVYGNDFNKIMRTLKSFVAKHESRAALTQIKLEHRAGSGTVTAIGLNGFVLAKIVVPALGEEDFDAIVPVTGQTRSESVIITDSGDRITFEHSKSFSISYPKLNGEYINWKQIMPQRESEYEISVNPHLLAEALSALPSSTRTVTLKFGSPVSPILIEQSSSEDQMLVLPVRVAK